MPNATRTAAPPQWNVINGTEQPEFLFGTPGPDLISGFGGEDLLLGEGGGDILQGYPFTSPALTAQHEEFA